MSKKLRAMTGWSLPFCVLVSVAGSPDAFAGLGSAGERNAVDTLAGPGFCREGTMVPDERSVTVRGLAVDNRGTGVLYVETGPLGAGLVSRVGDPQDVATPAILLGTGIKIEESRRDELAPGAQLARGGRGGALVAAGAKLLHLNGGLGPVAGDVRAINGLIGGRASGDGTPRFEARFRFILAVASDEAGNAYVADEIDPERKSFRIRFVNLGAAPVTFHRGLPGEITVAPESVETILGPPAGGNRKAQGGSQLDLRGGAPSLAVASGRLYLAFHDDGDRPEQSIAHLATINFSGERKVLHGVETIPGELASLIPGKDGSGRGALGFVSGLSASPAGSVIIADRARHRVVELDSSGKLTTVAGDPYGKKGGFNGNERPAATALLNRPADVEMGPQGRIYISDEMNGQVRFIDPAGTIRAAQGNGIGASWTCRRSSDGKLPGKTIPGRLRGSPQAVTDDRRGGALFLLDDLDQVQRLGSNGAVSSVVRLGNGRATDIEIGAEGVLYVREPDRVRAFNVGPRSLTIHGATVRAGRSVVVAGEGARVGGAREIGLSGVGDLATDKRGNLYVADGPAGVHRIDPQGGVEKLVGKVDEGEERCCRIAAQVEEDPHGNVFVLEAGAGRYNLASGPRVWFVNAGRVPVFAHERQIPAGGSIPVAGAKERPLRIDEERTDISGPATQVPLIAPNALTVDSRSNLYLADSDSTSVASESIILRVDPRGDIRRLAGAGGGRSFNGDGLPGPLTVLRVKDIYADRCGDLLLADAGNRRVRRLNLAGGCPAPGPSSRGVRGERRIPQGSLPWALGTLGALMAAAGLVLARKTRSKHTRDSSRPPP